MSNLNLNKFYSCRLFNFCTRARTLYISLRASNLYTYTFCARAIHLPRHYGRLKVWFFPPLSLRSAVDKSHDAYLRIARTAAGGEPREKSKSIFRVEKCGPIRRRGMAAMGLSRAARHRNVRRTNLSPSRAPWISRNHRCHVARVDRE